MFQKLAIKSFFFMHSSSLIFQDDKVVHMNTFSHLHFWIHLYMWVEGDWNFRRISALSLTDENGWVRLLMNGSHLHHAFKWMKLIEWSRVYRLTAMTDSNGVMSYSLLFKVNVWTILSTFGIWHAYGCIVYDHLS